MNIPWRSRIHVNIDPTSLTWRWALPRGANCASSCGSVILGHWRFSVGSSYESSVTALPRFLIESIITWYEIRNGPLLGQFVKTMCQVFSVHRSSFVLIDRFQRYHDSAIVRLGRATCLLSLTTLVHDLYDCPWLAIDIPDLGHKFTIWKNNSRNSNLSAAYAFTEQLGRWVSKTQLLYF